MAVKGWLEEGMDVREAYDFLRKHVNRFIYTSVERDGTLTGIEEIERFWGGTASSSTPGGASRASGGTWKN